MKIFSIWVDEAGRGSWAWPVVAGACALEKGRIYTFSPLLRDSKKLNEASREGIFTLLHEQEKLGTCFLGVGIIHAEIIDTVGIREANRLAMEIAIWEVQRKLAKITKKTNQKIQIDGRDNYHFENISDNQLEYIVHGDNLIPSIQAGAIMAKVTRDTLMKNLPERYKIYECEKHKWYGTKLHEKTLSIYGPSDIHRKSYAPIKKLILERNSI